MILPKASSTLDKIASSQALFSIWCTTAGGKSPPIGFCPTGNTPLPPLRALNRRARNAPGSASPYSKYSNSSIKLQGYRIDFFCILHHFNPLQK